MGARRGGRGTDPQDAPPPTPPGHAPHREAQKRPLGQSHEGTV